MFMVVDGIDGSGKGTIVACLKRSLAAKGLKVVDIGEATKSAGSLPGADYWADADIVVTAEPTYAGAGAALRSELLRDDTYDPLTVAHAFAVDREIHFRRVVIPALQAGKTVISERGISSSLAYQVMMGLPEETVRELPGNRLALENAPDYLVLAELDAETAVERLAARSGKRDDSYFERKPILEKLAGRYRDPDFIALFESRGTEIVHLSTAGEIKDTEARCEEGLVPLILGGESGE